MYKAKHVKKTKINIFYIVICVLLVIVLGFGLTFGKYIKSWSDLFSLDIKSYSQYLLATGDKVNAKILAENPNVTEVVFDKWNTDYATLLDKSSVYSGIHVGNALKDKIYLFEKDNKAYILSANEKNIYANPDSCRMFKNCGELKAVEFTNFNTTYHPTDSTRYKFTYFFLDCEKLETVDISGFDFTYTTHLDGFFSGCNILSDITFPGTDVDGMYNRVQTTCVMFDNCHALKTLDLSFFNSNQSLVDTSGMFSGCINLESLNFNPIGNLQHMDTMFKSCVKLTEIDISNLKTNNVSWMTGAFSECISLKKVLVHPDFTVKNVGTTTDPQKYDFQSYENPEELVRISRNSLERLFANCKALETFTTNKDNFDGDIADFDASLFTSATNVASTKNMFRNCSSIQSFNGLSSMATSSALIDTKEMFYMCKNPELTTLDLTGLVTTNVTDMASMFKGCSSVTKINATNKFSTANVTDMSEMFMDCSALTNLNSSDGVQINLAYFNTAKVKNFKSMFSGCSALTMIDISPFSSSAAIDTSYMFNNCSSATRIIFGSDFTTKSVTDMQYMFNGCTKVGSVSSNPTMDLKYFDTSNVQNMAYMFSGCSSVQVIYATPSTFLVSNVKDMTNMFNGCTLLSAFDLNNTGYINLTSFNPQNVTSMENMFQNCSAICNVKLPATVGGFNAPLLTTTKNMFNGCTNLVNLNAESIKTSNSLTDISFMFNDCTKLIGNGTNLTLTNMDISSVTSMKQTFNNCIKLPYIIFKGINTSNVGDFTRTFNDCRSLTTLDVSNGTFTAVSATTCQSMFQSCENLGSIDLSNFETTNVSNMEYMFFYCYKITSLDVSMFDTSKVTTMTGMFAQCNLLETIYSYNDFSTDALLQSNSMFWGCSSISGGNGTTYDAANITADYAKIDTETTKGYFTLKS